MEFPHSKDRARIATIQRNRHLWARDHADVFAQATKGMPDAEKKVVREQWQSLSFTGANMLRRLARDTAELLSLDPANIESEDDQASEAIPEVAKVSAWDRLALDATEALSALGEIGLRVQETRDGDYRIGMVEPDSIVFAEDYFGEYEAEPGEAVAPAVVSLHGSKGDYSVLFEIHTPGSVEWKAYRWAPRSGMEASSLAEEGKLGNEIDPSAIVPSLVASSIATGITESTLVLVQNEPDPYDRRHGLSDYTPDLVQLQREFETKLSITMRHFYELVNGGTTVLPEECKAMVMGGRRRANPDAAADFGRNPERNKAPTVDAAELTLIFEDSQSKGMTRHVSRSAQYEGGMKSLETLWSVFENIAGITLGRLFDQSAAPESGRALRLMRLKDLQRARRKAIRYSGSFARAFEVALLLNGIDAHVKYHFPDPFPLSLHEKIEAASEATSKPVMTTKTALIDILGYSQEQAENEVSALNADAHTDGLRSTVRGVFASPPVTPEDFGDGE